MEPSGRRVGRLTAWLLEVENPSARYLALRDLFDNGAGDPATAAAQEAISAWRPVHEVLTLMDPSEFWGRFGRPYYGGALSTQATLNVLAELGTPANAQIQAACGHLLEYGQHPDGGFGPNPTQQPPTLCYTGIAIRTLVRFRVGSGDGLEHAIDFLVQKSQDPAKLVCPYCSDPFCGWGISKALGAFSALPAPLRTPERMDAARALASVILDHTMDFEQRDAHWLQLGFPLDYQSDLAELCDAIAGLGLFDPVSDARFARLLDALSAAREPAGWWIKRFGTRVLQVERLGAPSKWITIRALRALRRSGRLATASVREVLGDERGA